MTSSSLRDILSIKESKAIINEDSTSNKLYLETPNSQIGKECLSRLKWFKGSSDRGFRGTLAEQKNGSMCKLGPKIQ